MRQSRIDNPEKTGFIRYNKNVDIKYSAHE